MSDPEKRHRDPELLLAAWIAAAVSILSFLYYYRHGDVLLYGDAVAHINIARRVFDSRTPGLLQLGTVWLPLPHLLMIPFLLSTEMWKTGSGGSLPSMIAYVLAVVGVFRLARGVAGERQRVAAWVAAAIFAANPNLIYIQATAMTESLFLALFVWAVVYFSENLRQPDGKAWLKCGLCLAGACLTRYDAWMLAAAMAASMLPRFFRPDQRRRVIGFLLVAATAPVLWLIYNGVVYSNPLEFANGPYSARAIERKSSSPGAAVHPGTSDLPVAFSFFVKAGEANVAEGNWGRVWLLVLVIGLSVAMKRRAWPLLFLLIPVPFYMLSIAYGGVPIFLPPWWPYTIYNARYGLELLPAFAVFSALAIGWICGVAKTPRVRTAALGAAFVAVGISYGFVWRAQPLCFREAWINSRTRIAMERELASVFEKLPRDSTFLMYLGDHVGGLQHSGIPLKQVINEGNHRPWVRPEDTEGLWERALTNPSRYVNTVVAFDGDPVATSANLQGLTPFAVIHVTGQPQATMYATHPSR